MDKIWYLAVLLLDSVPFTYFAYTALKNDSMHPPRAITLFFWFAITVAAAIPFFLVLFFISGSAEFLRLSRLAYALVLFGSILLSSKKAISKGIFVYSLIVPFSLGFATLASYIAQFIKVDAPPYMISSILRFCLILVSYPLMVFLWGKLGNIANRITDPAAWRYLWIIPASAAVSEILLFEKDYETTPLTVSGVLGRLVLWIGSFGVCYLLFFFANRLELRLHLEEANQRNSLLLELQKQQYLELAENIEQARAARHDLRHHINTIKAMSDNKDYERMQEYINQLSESVPVDRSIKICENYAANAVLYHYIQRAQNQEVPIKVSFRLSNSSGIADSDLCVLLGNMVENAIDAAEKVPSSNRFVTLSSLEEKDRIYITCDNSFSGELKKQNGLFLSEKRGFATTGVGLLSIKAIAKKYNGDIKIETEGNIFKISVLLFIP